MIKLSGVEKETIIIFNESSQEATVSTYNNALIKKIDGLCESRAGEVELIDKGETGQKVYTVPKKWVKINASRILDEEVRRKLSEAMKQRRQDGM